jgi:hypothetical protein
MARLAASTLVALIVASFATADQPSVAPAPTNPLVGRWQMVSMGKKKLPDNVRLFWTFDEHNLVVSVDDGDVVTKSQYSLRKERDHDVIALSEDGKKEPNRFGWYEVKDGQLRIQVTLDTGKPPERWNEGEIMILRPAPKPARPGGAGG